MSNVNLNIQLKFDKKVAVVFTITLLILVSMAAVFLYGSKAPPSTRTEIPISKLSYSNFAIYAPAKPPAGFILSKNDISGNDKAFVYVYTYDKNKRLVVTNQPKPKNFDVDQFNPTQERQARIGRVYTVELDDRTTAAIVTDESLVFVNTSDKISSSDFTAFIDSLRRAQSADL